MDFLALRYAVYNAAHTLTHGFLINRLLVLFWPSCCTNTRCCLWFLPRWSFWTASLAG